MVVTMMEMIVHSRNLLRQELTGSIPQNAGTGRVKTDAVAKSVVMQKRASKRMFISRQNLLTALEELERIHDQSQCNPVHECASDRAYSVAKSWLFRVFRLYPNLSAPFVLLPGDGGVILKWNGDDGNFVSVNFDADDEDLDITFARFDGIKQSDDFTKERLDQLLSILSHQTKPDIAYVQGTGEAERTLFRKRIQGSPYSKPTFSDNYGQVLG
ncbi:MAG TPA: hypothetical protein VMM38_09025 [Aridibacter sp.]|nr:hypothetical protein [Aridibacter sp.]